MFLQNKMIHNFSEHVLQVSHFAFKKYLILINILLTDYPFTGLIFIFFKYRMILHVKVFVNVKKLRRDCMFLCLIKLVAHDDLK